MTPCILNFRSHNVIHTNVLLICCFASYRVVLTDYRRRRHCSLSKDKIFKKIETSTEINSVSKFDKTENGFIIYVAKSIKPKDEGTG